MTVFRATGKVSAREQLAILLLCELPVTDDRPLGDETEPCEVFMEGIANLLAVADAIIARGWANQGLESAPSTDR